MKAESSSAKKEWLFLLTTVALYLFVFFWYYPPVLGIEDEAGYINQTFVWLRGSVSAEGAGYENLAIFEEYRGRLVSWGSPGRSLAILPFWILFGAKGIFVSGAAIHVLTVLLAAWLLHKLNVSPVWAALILFHPTLALYSRTVMSDELAGLLLLAAVWAATWQKRSGAVWVGVFIGLAALTRSYAAFAAPFFIFVLYRQKGWRAALNCFLTTGFFGALVIAYNFYIFGNAAGRPVYQSAFALGNLPDRLSFYVPALLLLYPLILFAPFVDRSEIGGYVRAVCLPTLGLLLFYFFNETGANYAQTLILGQRLLQTALPVWILSYALTLNRFAEKSFVASCSPWLKRAAAVAVCVALLAGQTLIFRRHQQHLLDFKFAQDEVARLVPANSLVIANRNLTKLLGTPAMGAPPLRWRVYHFVLQPYDHSAEIGAERNDWYLALLPKFPGDELPELLQDYVSRYKMERVETAHPNLILYRARPANGER